jgi:ANTAR domain-containing protein
VTGEQLHAENGEVIGTQGVYLDVTPSDEERPASISQARAEIAGHRAGIEQPKGVLMYVYGVGPDAAFDVLQWRSQESNVNLRALAAQPPADVRTLMHNEGCPTDRPTFDQLLLTAHERGTARSAQDVP